MNKIIVAVGSKRGPKLKAVEQALSEFAARLAPGAEFEVLGAEVDSGVSHTPLTREELMRGAVGRVEALQLLARSRGETWSYFVGLEGGLDVVGSNRPGQNPPAEPRVLLESWVYASDGVRGFYGRSGGIELPRSLAEQVLTNRVELAEAIDRFAGAVGIRDGLGAWGVLSGNLISRQESFRVAVIAAFAPFYNASLYGAGASASGFR